MTGQYTRAADNKALNAQEKTDGRTVLASTPIRISMNMTGKCNIRCIYCHLTFADYYTKSELELEQFKSLDPFLKRLSHLVYFSSTEPLMARHFDDIFDYSTHHHCEKYISTNGILLTRERAENLVKGEMEFVTISFGGMTKDSFKTAHQVDALEKVTDNIRTLNEIKRTHGVSKPRLRIVFVTWKDNAHELPLAVQYAHDHQCSEGLKITFLKAYDDNLIDQIAYDHQPYINKYVAEAQALGNELGVKVEFDGGNFDDSMEEVVHSFHRKCFEPWERFHIEADGKVRTCPVPINTIVAGDLNEQTPEEIWNGEVYQMFRERTNTADPPDPCKRCTHNFHKDFTRRDIWDQRDLDLGIYNRLEDRNYLKRGNKGAKRRP